MMEILYSSPMPRNFQFDFQFSPRDEKEAKEVQDIIDSTIYEYNEVCTRLSNSKF